MDATAFIHSFLVNVFGAVDNLARIWCLEANVRQAKGTAVPDSHIGFGPKNSTVRTSLSEGFQDYLRNTDAWFEYLENYRHALAHRIPLYVPRKTLGSGDVSEWNRLEAEIAVALRNRDFQLYGSLFRKQMSLGSFVPAITHSFGESTRPVFFHGQMLCDFATVVEIGEHLLMEFETLDKSAAQLRS